LIGKAMRVLGGAALVVLLWSSTAHAQAGAESVQGFVRNEHLEDGKTVRDPVAGVKITFLTADGSEVGAITTDEKGAYTIPLPGPGNYRAKLDESSLPKDVSLRDKAQADVTFVVRPNETHILNYFLGQDTRVSASKLSQLPQTIANGLKFGLIIAICAVGLSLIYGTTGLANFSHGELVTLGAIVAWNFNTRVGWNLLLAAPVGIAAAAVAAGAMEAGIFRPMRRRGIGLTSMMIVSIGLGLALRYVYQYTFGGRSRAFADFAVQRAIDLPLSIELTPRSLISMAICVATLIGVALFLLKTRQGKAVRAVSDNPDLSSATGINTDRVILLVWILGGALAGLGGVLLGLDEQVRWDSGFTLLLLMFAAITLGGLGNPFGALVGSIVVGLFVELWTWVFSSVVELKTLGALIALIVILLIRPQGILGTKERVG
jgi:neutral amino acid transport system permease protein